MLMKAQITFLFLAFFALSSAHAVFEAVLPYTWKNEKLPALKAKMKDDFFMGFKLVPIHYTSYLVPNPKGVIAISPGKGEPTDKYLELIDELSDLDFDIYVIDHRGQGLSGRLLDDPSKAHVDEFTDYVMDFEGFIEDVVKPKNYPKSFILAHSMGGTIAAGFLRKFPHAVTGAILSSPMMRIKTPKFFLNPKFDLDLKLAKILDLFGKAEDYGPTQGPFQPEKFLSENDTTSSPERFAAYQELRKLNPDLQIGGTTVRWLLESLRYSKKLRQTDNVFQVPTLILQAGADQLVRPEAQNEICARSPKGPCEVKVIANSQHEILMERDEIRYPAIKLIRQFIDQH